MTATRETKELTFLDHLEELRLRIVRGVVYLIVGTAVALWQAPLLLDLLRWPAEVGARRAGVGELVFRVFEPAGGFMLLVHVSLVAGVVLAGPFLLLEAWRFVEPALRPQERRWALLTIPGVTALFLGGVALCYVMAPIIFAFLFTLNQRLGVEVELTLGPYLVFFIKLLLVFGLSFEMPVLVMVLGLLGLVSSEWLLRQWRYAVVIIAILAAVATPTGDPVTMSILAGPLVGLYFLSVRLVRLIERGRPAPETEEPAEAEAPPPSPDLMEEAEEEREAEAGD